MNIAERFLAYAADFEKAYADDDWSRLQQYFTPDAIYKNEPKYPGRTALIENFKRRVDAFDRTMASRSLEFQPPSADGNTVTARWQSRYTNPGLPDLVFSGSEFAIFRDELIEALRDELDAGAESSIRSWLVQHRRAR